MSMTQNKQQRTIFLPIVAIAFAAALILGGCATDKPIAPQGIEQRVENARTASDHQDIAATYEQQAKTDKATADQHRKLALSYAKSWNPVILPWNRTSGSVPKGNPSMVRHCENLANLYEQASKANLELAAEHRRAAVGDTK